VEERLPRRLAAILYADVAGYSRLTGEDEDSTHHRLSEYLDLISSTVEGHRGHVMHYAGDAVLAMFEAVVDAVSGAVAIQIELQTRNQDLPDERKVQFRIGVNLGDVIEDRGDIYGDGVNVAARLESLADPGGICLSESVRTAVGKKLDLGFEFMGEREVKNIAEPVRAYRVMLRTAERKQATMSSPHIAEIPDKPSIAVLPFDNLSGDPEQVYFADGMAEEIITALSHYR
jgi:adenylate cyclase